MLGLQLLIYESLQKYSLRIDRDARILGRRARAASSLIFLRAGEVAATGLRRAFDRGRRVNLISSRAGRGWEIHGPIGACSPSFGPCRVGARARWIQFALELAKPRTNR
jgi:hypothetical protein